VLLLHFEILPGRFQRRLVVAFECVVIAHLEGEVGGRTAKVAVQDGEFDLARQCPMQIRPVVQGRGGIQPGVDYGLHELVGTVQAGGLKENGIGALFQLQLRHKTAALIGERRLSGHLRWNADRRCDKYKAAKESHVHDLPLPLSIRQVRVP